MMTTDFLSVLMSLGFVLQNSPFRYLLRLRSNRWYACCLDKKDLFIPQTSLSLIVNIVCKAQFNVKIYFVLYV